MLEGEVKTLTRVGEDVVAVGPRQRPTAVWQSECRDSLQTMHLEQEQVNMDQHGHWAARGDKPETNLAKLHPLGAHSAFFTFQHSLLSLNLKPPLKAFIILTGLYHSVTSRTTAIQTICANL